MDKKNVLLDILRPFGIVSQYAGCAQLIRAVELTLENPDAIQAVHKQIYAVIAKEQSSAACNIPNGIGCCVGDRPRQAEKSGWLFAAWPTVCRGVY